MEKVALIFSGQGSQYLGMGKSLYDRYDIVKKIYSQASDVLNFDISSLCVSSNLAELTKTQNAQVAIFTTSYAAYQAYLQETEQVPYVLAGHSLGEYTALTTANVIRFSDALHIVRKRGELMNKAADQQDGGMAAVLDASVETIYEICESLNKQGKSINISNYNSSKQTIISGQISAIELATEKLNAYKANVIPLQVGGAFHSLLMQPVKTEFQHFLESFVYFPFMLPVISSVDGEMYADETVIVDYLTKQLTSPVHWTRVMDKIKESGVTKVIETGPKDILKKFILDYITNISCVTIDQDILSVNDLNK